MIKQKNTSNPTLNEINIYYRGTNQKFKYYGPFDEESVKITIKQFFRINDPIDDIYFQDEDGDIVVLNEQTPSGISVYIYCESDSMRK